MFVCCISGHNTAPATQGTHAALTQLPSCRTYSVRALVRPTSDTRSLQNLGIEYVAGSLTDTSSLAPALVDVQVVIHAAAVLDLYPKTELRRQEITRTNVGGTEKLLHAAKAAGVDKFVYVSSTEAVGACSHCNETVPLAPLHLYGETKGQAEALVRASGLQHVILRLPGLFGPADRYIMYEFTHMIWVGLLFFVPGDGAVEIMYSHVEDAAAALGLAVRALMSETPAVGETFFIGPEEALSLTEWIHIMADATNRARPAFSLPLPVVRAVTMLLAPVLNAGKTRIGMHDVGTIDRMHLHATYSTEKAQLVLGFKSQYPIRSSLPQTIRAQQEVSDLTLRSSWPY